MSDVDPTPETPVTVGDRLGWFRGDVAGRLTALQTDISALRGDPEATLAAIRADLSALRGLSNTSLGQLLSESQYVSAQVQLNSKLLDIRSDLDALRVAIGAEPYNDLELGSVRGLLNAILRAVSQGTSGIPPAAGDTDIGNVGTAIISGRKYAVFVPPINGVSIGENGINVTATGSWSGWHAYVQTNAPSFYLNETLDIANEWIQLVGTGSYNFAVENQYSIRVFLRPPAGLVVGAQQFTSISYTQAGGTNSGWVFSGVSYVTTRVNDFSSYPAASQPVYWVPNAIFRLRQPTAVGSGYTVGYKTSQSGGWTWTTLQVGQWYTFPVAIVYTAYSGGAGRLIEIAPGPS